MRAQNWLYATVLALVLALGGATRGFAQEGGEGLDSRLARLEAENATLKKRLRIEALERENAALKKRLGSADASRREAEPISAEPVRKRTSRSEMLAYAKATPPPTLRVCCSPQPSIHGRAFIGALPSALPRLARK